MITSLPIRPRSAFDDLGFAGTMDALVAQTQELYRADGVPWVIGYSGGKDSTAVLQIVWQALQGLEPKQRSKPVPTGPPGLAEDDAVLRVVCTKCGTAGILHPSCGQHRKKRTSHNCLVGRTLCVRLSCGRWQQVRIDSRVRSRGAARRCVEHAYGRAKSCGSFSADQAGRSN